MFFKPLLYHLKPFLKVYLSWRQLLNFSLLIPAVPPGVPVSAQPVQFACSLRFHGYRGWPFAFNTRSRGPMLVHGIPGFHPVPLSIPPANESSVFSQTVALSPASQSKRSHVATNSLE
jgi:hypothetical protein